MRDHCFLMTQNEKRRYEKKKQLWGQYKQKMAEKIVKKKKEAEEASALVIKK